MHDRADNLFAAFKREPEATKWLLRFGVGVPVLIVLWDQIGSRFLSSFLVGVVDLLAILVYGAGLSVLIVRIMIASERWGVESALTARKITNRVQLRDDEQHQPESRAVTAATSFQEAHFLRRLQEEVAASRRAGSHLSLIWLDVNVPGEDPYPAQVEKMATDVAELLATQSKTIGSSFSRNLNEHLFTLPHHSRTEAREFMRKLVLGLGRYWCHCGIAEYPADATDAEKLFERARERCDASREGRDEPAAKAV